VTIIATSIPFLRLLAKEMAMRVRTPKLDVNSLESRRLTTATKPATAVRTRPGSEAGGKSADTESIDSNAEKRVRSSSS
jgi:hypothetical protein